MPYTFEPYAVTTFEGVTYHPRRSYTVDDQTAERMEELGIDGRLYPHMPERVAIRAADTTYDELEDIIDQMDDRLDLGRTVQDRPAGQVPATMGDLSLSQRNLIATYLTGGFTEVQINSTVPEVRRGQLDFRVYTADRSATSRQILTTQPHGAGMGAGTDHFFEPLRNDPATINRMVSAIREQIDTSLADMIAEGTVLPLTEMPRLVIGQDGETLNIDIEVQRPEPARRNRVTTTRPIKTTEATYTEVDAYLTKALANTNVPWAIAFQETKDFGKVVAVGYEKRHRALMMALLSPATIKDKEWGRIVSDPGFSVTREQTPPKTPGRKVRIRD